MIAAPLEPMAVIAGAGSGKSETMAARLVWLVANGMVGRSGCSASPSPARPPPSWRSGSGPGWPACAGRAWPGTARRARTVRPVSPRGGPGGARLGPRSAPPAWPGR